MIYNFVYVYFPLQPIVVLFCYWCENVFTNHEIYFSSKKIPKWKPWD